MNPSQRDIYEALGHDDLVIVRKSELDALFNL